MQQFFALTALVAVAHATELQLLTEQVIDNGEDTANTMWDADYEGRDFYKKGTYDGSSGDAEVRPLCSVKGMENQVDHQGPSDQCCRTYDYADFSGNYRDWCLYADYDPATWLQVGSKQYDLDSLGWHDDITSWKCGSKVTIKMCKHEDNLESDWDAAWDTAENCHEGHNSNKNMGADADVMDQLIISPQGPADDHCIATVYSGDDCSGEAFMISSDARSPGTPWDTLSTQEQWMGSWMHYDESKDPLLAAGNIKSVMFKGVTGDRCVIEFFDKGNFRSDSFTLKSVDGQGESCHAVPFVPPVQDVTPTNRWTGNDLTAYTDSDITGVKALQIRREYFPDL